MMRNQLLLLVLVGLALIGETPLICAQAVRQEKPTPAPFPKPTPVRKTETFTQRLLRIFGLTVAPNLLKGDEDDLRGDLWLADVSNGTVRRLTNEDDYRSPVILDDHTAWALKGDVIVEVPLNGIAVVARQTIPSIIKLAGISADARQVVILRDEAKPVVELLAITDGTRTVLPYAADDEPMLAYLRGWQRSYDQGRVTLYTQSETKAGAADTVIEWRDVYLKAGAGEPVNLSHGDGQTCGQPALSPNQRWVIFVKTARR